MAASITVFGMVMLAFVQPIRMLFLSFQSLVQCAYSIFARKNVASHA